MTDYTYILYRLEPKIIDGKANGWFTYIPIHVLSSIENGHTLIANVDNKKTGKYKTMEETTFVGTFLELKKTLEWDWEKRLEKNDNGIYMIYDYFLCTTQLSRDSQFPQINHFHPTVLSKGIEPTVFYAIK